MKSTSLPSRPWEMLGTDICHVKGNNILVQVDYYSRWLEIKHLKKKHQEAIIKKLKEIFCIHGIADIVISDNAPQYVSVEFEEFTFQYGFTHTTSGPYFPHGNVEAERAVQTMKCIIVQNNPDIALKLLINSTQHYSS